MDLASVVPALASVGVRVSGSTPNNNIQGDSSRACPTGLAGPEPSGTNIDPGQHFHVRHQAPYGRLLRFAAGPGVSRPIPPSAWHGTAGSAKGGGGWGSRREHVRQVRNGCGVPQVHVDPQKGSARRARAFV